MTLKQAVQEVIRQNTAVCKYPPTRFIQMTEHGEATDLEGVISGLVLDPEIMKRIIDDLEKHRGKPIFIEEFIAMYGFGLNSEVIKEATERTALIQKTRLFYINNRL